MIRIYSTAPGGGGGGGATTLQAVVNAGNVIQAGPTTNFFIQDAVSNFARFDNSGMAVNKGGTTNDPNANYNGDVMSLEDNQVNSLVATRNSLKIENSNGDSGTMNADNISFIDNIGSGDAVMSFNRFFINDAAGNNFLNLNASSLELSDGPGNTNTQTATQAQYLDTSGNTNLQSASQIQLKDIAATPGTTTITSSLLSVGIPANSVTIANKTVVYATASFATTIGFTNPTAARTITIPNDTGTVVIKHAGKAANIAVAGSTVTFAHGVSGAGNSTLLYLTPLDANFATSAVTGWFASVNATNITITFLVAPLATTVSFYWQLIL